MQSATQPNTSHQGLDLQTLFLPNAPPPIATQPNMSPQGLDLRTLSLPNAQDLIAQSLDLLKPIQREEALVIMAHQLIEIRQESGSTLGVAARHVLEAIEGYKPWESMGICRNNYSQIAAIGELKEVVQFHHGTMRYKLAKVATLVALPESIKLFRFLVDRRKKNPQRDVSKEAHLKPGDLRILRGTIEGKIPSESSFGITLSLTPNSDKVGVGLGDQNPDTQSEPTEAGHLVANRECDGHNHYGFDHDNDSNNDGNNNGESWGDSDGSNNDSKSWGDSDSSSQCTSPRTAKRVKGPYCSDCQEQLGPVVLLIEKLDPKAIGDCQEVLRELIFSDYGYEDKFDGERFT
ncbi:hypothetical protein EV426DRAFT_707614 [Tirmania nivea]|nr:hypothetical protein EV426DRAFT_707614 [Tirmania nivea]